MVVKAPTRNACMVQARVHLEALNLGLSHTGQDLRGLFDQPEFWNYEGD
jgi:hypothetical protein